MFYFWVLVSFGIYLENILFVNIVWIGIGGKYYCFKRGYKNVIDEGICFVSLFY